MMQPPTPTATQADLLAEVASLRSELANLQQEKQNLELMLEVAMQHSDAIAENLQSENEDLAVLLEMTTEHSDAVEEELHQKAEEVLRESERRLRLIVQATPVPVIISRLADGKIVYANEMCGPLLKLPTAALLGCNLADFYYDSEEYHVLVEMLEDQGEINHYEVGIRPQGGELLWAEVSLRPLTFADEPSVLCALHDITERIVYQRQLTLLNAELADRNQLLGRLGVDIAHGARTPLLNATDVSDLLPELIAMEEYDEIQVLSEALGEKARTGLKLLTEQLTQITQLIGDIQAQGAAHL